MKNITKQRRNGVIVALLVAVLACLALITGFTASTQPRAKAESEYRDAKVGITTPSEGFYKDLVSYAVGQLSQLYRVEEVPCSDANYQLSTIDMFISDKVDVIIVAPINSDALVGVLNYAYSEGIKIIVLGDYNSNYPSGITYITKDGYYDLGISHASIICNEHAYNKDFSVRIFYYDNSCGRLYRQGIEDGLSDNNFIGSVEYFSVNEAKDAYDYMEEWFRSKKSDRRIPEIDEIVTYSEKIAQNVIRSYYDEGYRDDTCGTGIRMFVDEINYQETYLPAIANMVANAAEAIITGADPGYSEMINDSYMIYYDFAPGRVQYVSD